MQPVILRPRMCELVKLKCAYWKICTHQCGKKLSELDYEVSLQKMDEENITERSCSFCKTGSGQGMAVVLKLKNGRLYPANYIICRNCGRIYGEY